LRSEEFKILRNSYGPEFGGAGGAQINIVTRRRPETTSTERFLVLRRNDALNAERFARSD